MSETVKHLCSCQCILGEGPLWLEQKQALVFLDIIGKKLLYWRNKEGLKTIPLSQKVGSICAISEDRFLAASVQGLFELDANTGNIKSIGYDQIISKDALMNDGKADRNGGFVFGSKSQNEIDPIGKLMGFSHNISELWTGGIVLNGPAFSLDGKRIYFADSPSRNIYTAKYDPEKMTIGTPDIFTTIPTDGGYPDGMTVDSEGYLWSAQWDGWCISRYHPNGKLVQTIEMPVSRPTSVAFGGSDLKTLFITSAKKGLEQNLSATEQMAGDLFSIKLDVAGVVETNQKDKLNA
ncbi:MAG: SMP-30/gluconolactonase/LRE family protein [Kordiimonadaceae bacterium]|jgi:sugar lactone lactonase YvrE|nr:SMP-30/gluconolactonase/LRE family protein [Kordiimonadaceae bacterium]MBT6031856.1 SMP-30/gluconolactonase/LRE family protein [Kordiimonadaceae bacterium]